MSVALPSIVAILYFITGLSYLFKADYAWAIVWISYALANVGLILVGLRS